MIYCCDKFKEESYIKGQEETGGSIEQKPDGGWWVLCDPYLVIDDVKFCPFCGSKLISDIDLFSAKREKTINEYVERFRKAFPEDEFEITLPEIPETDRQIRIFSRLLGQSFPLIPAHPKVQLNPFVEVHKYRSQVKSRLMRQMKDAANKLKIMEHK